MSTRCASRAWVPVTPPRAGSSLVSFRRFAIGGAGLAAQAIELDLVDELRMFPYPVVVGGGTPFLPPVTEDIARDLVETQDVRLARDLRALRACPR